MTKYTAWRSKWRWRWWAV